MDLIVACAIPEVRDLSSSVTVLLQAHRNGEAGALDRLASALYPELKAMARRRSCAGAGTGATTLVNETFVKLLSGGEVSARDRGQFFGLVAIIMRQVIVDEIRYFTANKRARDDVTLADTLIGDDAHEKAEFLLEVNEILDIVEKENERHARVFECRYFAGMTTLETAEALGLSRRSVERYWSEVRSRIRELLSSPGDE